MKIIKNNVLSAKLLLSVVFFCDAQATSQLIESGNEDTQVSERCMDVDFLLSITQPPSLSCGKHVHFQEEPMVDLSADLSVDFLAEVPEQHSQKQAVTELNPQDSGKSAVAFVASNLENNHFYSNSPSKIVLPESKEEAVSGVVPVLAAVQSLYCCVRPALAEVPVVAAVHLYTPERELMFVRKRKKNEFFLPSPDGVYWEDYFLEQKEISPIKLEEEMPLPTYVSKFCRSRKKAAR